MKVGTTVLLTATGEEATITATLRDQAGLFYHVLCSDGHHYEVTPEQIEEET